MRHPSEGPNPEHEPNREVYSDLTAYITYVFDDAFELQREQGEKGYSEYVSVDTHSIQGMPLFSVLLSETGGKPEIGAETIRLLAKPKNPDMSVEYAAGEMRDPKELVFFDNEYFIVSQDRTGSKSYFRIDDTGLYPWVPQLKDVLAEEPTEELGIDSVDVLDFLNSTLLTESDSETEDSQISTQLEKIDREEAQVIIGKIDQWPIIPQN